MKRFTYEKDGKQWSWWNSDDKYYCTNSMGEGVFEIARGNRKQLTGTCQFSVAGLKDSSAKKKILGFMKDKFGCWDD
ncbi:hypothetical protein ACE418_03100 [Megasphaera sp. WILCCON 0056]|uniref:hypothetical protein n=1 Tax=Megasphaera sp. WILCCON 0056 TaxID=3345340 RepID=UPI003A8059CA